jgi:tRNA A-37 threonylcarbamoyl transferase component Bud32
MTTSSPRGPDLTQPIPGYEILELLGSGGMSSVYRARHKGLDRPVAIKVIRRDQIDPGLALARLLKEARVLARLDHPSIVRSIDYGEIGDLVFFVMELVEGRSCKQLLIDRGRFPLREVILIGERVASALGHAASHGVIHRDVKPANILLAKDGAVKLTDFGLARASRDRSLTQDGITVGTPQYMSPEQVRSPRRVDLRSDLYSLGATLYHLATGEPPLRGDSVGEILHDVLYASPKPPEQIVPTLPPGFSRVLARLLAKDAKRRYASARELITDLEKVRHALAEGGDDDSVGLSWQESAEPPARTVKPWLFGAAALVIATVTAFALLHDRLGRGRVDPLVDAKTRESRVLQELAESLDGGKQPAAVVLSRIGELQRDGSLTRATVLERSDLRTRAETAFQADLDGAAKAASTDAKRALARGDLNGAEQAFETAFESRCAQIVPTAIAAGLEAAGVDVAASKRPRATAYASDIADKSQRVRRQVAVALTDERHALLVERDAALTEGRLGDLRRTLAEYPARERKACAAATRTALVAAGVELAPDVTDEELASHWPDLVRSELEREPVGSFVQQSVDELAYAIERRQQDLLAQIRESGDADERALESGTGDPAELHRKLEERLAPQRAALAGVDALPSGLDAAWKAYDARLAQTQARRIAGERQAAIAKLLGERGDSRALRGLLEARNVAAARQLIAGTPGLAQQDVAAWNGVVDDLEAVLNAALATLKKQAGTETQVQTRSRLTIRGPLLVDTQAGLITVNKIPIKVEELSRAWLEPIVTITIDGDARQLAVRFFLSDEPKDRAALDPVLEKLEPGPVVDALRAIRAEEAAGAEKSQAELESAATEARAALDAALEKGDGEAAAKQLEKLISPKYTGTAASRKASAERGALDKKIAEARKGRRALALLADVAPHATERSVEQDESVRFLYRFDKVEEGSDFGITASSERVEGGRLVFAGTQSELRAREEGLVLKLPLDRRKPATLKLEIAVPYEDKRTPHFVGLRLGGVSVGFFRPREAVGATFDPELAAWFGPLNEFEKIFFDPAVGQVESTSPRKVTIVPKGLERGASYDVELRWDPDPTASTGTFTIWLRGEQVYKTTGTMPPPPEGDGLELRSATALRIESLEFRGRLRE